MGEVLVLSPYYRSFTIPRILFSDVSSRITEEWKQSLLYIVCLFSVSNFETLSTADKSRNDFAILKNISMETN